MNLKVFVTYYMLLAELKDFNALIHGKSFFQAVKNKQEAREEPIGI